MFIIIVLLLQWFQTDDLYPISHPQRWVGYFAAGALLYGTGVAILGRVRKEREYHRFSHYSDWLFPILLLLLGASGILIHIFRYIRLPLATYYAYALHMVLVPATYFVVGPMGKWAHIFYRPLAVFFEAVIEKAAQAQTFGELAPSGFD
jgi:hypothetical protein